MGVAKSAVKKEVESAAFGLKLLRQMLAKNQLRWVREQLDVARVVHFEGRFGKGVLDLIWSFTNTSTSPAILAIATIPGQATLHISGELAYELLANAREHFTFHARVMSA